MSHAATLPRLAALVCCGIATANALAAGCVTSRGTGVPNDVFARKSDLSFLDAANAGAETSATDSRRVQMTVALRGFRSDRHFVGDNEQGERAHEGSEVINTSRFLDVSFAYALSDRTNLTLTLPFVDHDRSQVVRRNDAQRTILNRFHTQSSGIGDVQFLVNRWMLDGDAASRGNIMLTAGIDLPTGDEDARDTFDVYDAGTSSVVKAKRTVDQSIQPGDGGYGVILGGFAHYDVAPGLTAYVDGSYVVTPQETNGVPTFRTGNPFEGEMSIADSYLLRAGMEYLVYPARNVKLNLAVRREGVPVRDVTGGSAGFRRPGFVTSLETGVSMQLGTWSFDLYVPVAIDMERTRSVNDIKYTQSSGRFRHGDAAFSDLEATFAVTRRF